MVWPYHWDKTSFSRECLFLLYLFLNLNFTIRLSIGFFFRRHLPGRRKWWFLSMHEKTRSIDKFWTCDAATMSIFLFLYHLGLRNWQLFSLFSKIFFRFHVFVLVDSFSNFLHDYLENGIRPWELGGHATLSPSRKELGLTQNCQHAQIANYYFFECTFFCVTCVSSFVFSCRILEIPTDGKK